MTTTNNDHDDQLGEIYPRMLNELKCTFAVSFHVFIAVAVMVMVCGRHGLWLSWYRPESSRGDDRQTDTHMMQPLHNDKKTSQA